VVVAGLLAARGDATALMDDRFLLLGAGAAGIGIARMLERVSTGGVIDTPEGPRLAIFDHAGLVHRDRTTLAADQRPFAVDPAWFLERGLMAAQLADPVAVARVLEATVLIGATGTRGAFSERLVREVAEHAAAPVVLPLSNPGDRAEASPADIAHWTAGRALIATGSPSGEVVVGGRVRTVGQANNVFIFPGLGLGAMVAEARAVTDDVLLVAAQTLAGLSTPDRLAAGAIYPPVTDLRRVARSIAIAVVRHLRDTGYGRQYRDEEIATAVDRAMWWPDYLSARGDTDGVRPLEG
jgi:malic enzyme